MKKVRKPTYIMDELNDRFKKSAENFLITPLSGTWEKIEADIIKRRKRKSVIYISFSLLGIFLVASWFINRNVVNETKIPSHQQVANHAANVRPDNGVRNYEKSVLSSIESKGQNHELTSQVPAQHTKQITEKKSKSFTLPVMTSSSGNIFEKIKSEKAEVQSTTQPAILAISGNGIVTSVDSVIIDTSLAIPAVKDTSLLADIDPSLIDSIETSLLNITDDKRKIDSTKVQPDSSLMRTNKTIKRWSLAFGLAPTWNYNRWKEDGDFQIIANYRDSSDKNMLQWNYHFAIHYLVLSKLEIISGIGLSNFKVEMLNRQAVYHYDTSAATGPGTSSKITVSKSYFNLDVDSFETSSNKITYLDIPLSIRYYLHQENKFKISIQPGVTYRQMIRSEGYSYSYQDRNYQKLQEAELRSGQFVYGVGLSFNYEILKNLYFDITPFYKNSASSIYKDSYPLSQKLQSFEIQMAIRYCVK